MRRVLVFGTFDVVHQGHLSFFSQAKEYGEFLIVVVGRDETVAKVKGKPPQHNERERLERVRSLAIVDKAVFGRLGDPYDIIEEIDPDVICLGYDQDSFSDNLMSELKKRKIAAEVIRLRGFKENIYKTSRILEKSS